MENEPSAHLYSSTVGGYRGAALIPLQGESNGASEDAVVAVK